ncbi:DotU family type IV/VI secretion system protein [Parashewanella curva]|uniref:DotU family type IV/VI secretion system protein n=1 Tax=Parashewanella curva TaxID=2338552 RepID=A0A3L8Q2M3_9GAMM|nr:type IVB secretion system protein IcmH/DotU [Parashewanella curva]RLV61249.1 DotU family type IV/VI secretion system protein [Parashewanella curva]
MANIFSDEPTVVIRREQSSPENHCSDEENTPDLTGTEKLIEKLVAYKSPLLNAATQLLGILVSIPRQGQPKDIDRFRQRLLDAISHFKSLGVMLDYHPSVIQKSSFVLCAAFDEAILYTKWGEDSRWVNHSLLSKSFSERNGGEVFFQLLERASLQPQKLVDFIELQYVLMMLGFQGKYRHNDETELHEIKSNTFKLIRNFREETALPVPLTPKLPEALKPWRMVSFRKVLLAGSLILLVIYMSTEYWYFRGSKLVLDQFVAMNESIPATGAKNNTLGDETHSQMSHEQSMQNQMNAVRWEVFLGVYTNPSDATQLGRVLEDAGYHTSVIETQYGIELVLSKTGDLATIRELANELNIRFGLNATIRKVQ